MQKWHFLTVYSAFSGKTFIFLSEVKQAVVYGFVISIRNKHVAGGCDGMRVEKEQAGTLAKHCNVRNHRRISFKFIYQKRSEIWRRKSLKPFRNWIEKTWLPLDKVCLK